MGGMAVTLISAVLLQDGVLLEHRGKRGQAADYDQIIQFGIEFKGPEDQVDRVKALSPFFSIENMVIEAVATHEVLTAPKDGAPLWRQRFAKAKIHGTYAGEEFEYRFAADRKEEPGDDKLKGIAYALFLAGRSHKLSKRGAMEDLDPNKDPNGEALDMILYPMPRFRDVPVKVGDSWSEEWTTRTQDKDGGHRLRLKQSVTLEKIENGVAHLRVELGGEIQKPADAKGWTEQVTPKGDARVRFDVERGHVVGYESSGVVDIHIKGTDPNTAEEYDVHLLLRGRGRLAPR